MFHDFSLGIGWYGNISYSCERNIYTGILYTTSEYSGHVSWEYPFTGEFESEEEFLIWAENYIRKNDT